MLRFPERCLRLAELLSSSGQQKQRVGMAVAQHVTPLAQFRRPVLRRKSAAFRSARFQGNRHLLLGLPTPEHERTEILALVQR